MCFSFFWGCFAKVSGDKPNQLIKWQAVGNLSMSTKTNQGNRIIKFLKNSLK